MLTNVVGVWCVWQTVTVLLLRIKLAHWLSWVIMPSCCKEWWQHPCHMDCHMHQLDASTRCHTPGHLAWLLGTHHHITSHCGHQEPYRDTNTPLFTICIPHNTALAVYYLNLELMSHCLTCCLCTILIKSDIKTQRSKYTYYSHSTKQSKPKQHLPFITILLKVFDNSIMHPTLSENYLIFTAHDISAMCDVMQVLCKKFTRGYM